MLRILTRLWSEDSSTPVSTETQSQRKEGIPKPRPTKQKAARTNPKQKGGEGESVEKPDTSLARQFKHLNRKQEEQSTRQENKQDSTDKAAPKAVRE